MPRFTTTSTRNAISSIAKLTALDARQPWPSGSRLPPERLRIWENCAKRKQVAIGLTAPKMTSGNPWAVQKAYQMHCRMRHQIRPSQTALRHASESRQPYSPPFRARLSCATRSSGAPDIKWQGSNHPRAGPPARFCRPALSGLPPRPAGRGASAGAQLPSVAAGTGTSPASPDSGILNRHSTDWLDSFVNFKAPSNRAAPTARMHSAEARPTAPRIAAAPRTWPPLHGPVLARFAFPSNVTKSPFAAV